MLALCGAAWFPLHRDGAPARVYGVAFGLSALCLLLALLLTRRRPALPALGAAVAVPAALAAARLLVGRIDVAGLSRSLELTAAPPWITGLLALAAALTALAALCVRPAGARPAPQPAASPAAVGERVSSE
ncbi:hypothetical protein [Streptomyces sp. NPDC014006]|uniref:hypothetical protein n=1 Tax=Streptomyces sp. NPDC014006 TaxID=3364870 RepID=UPI0036FDCC8C